LGRAMDEAGHAKPRSRKPLFLNTGRLKAADGSGRRFVIFLLNE